ncbi:hypothetical protein NBO_81g0026 [Nosema bombycis CQ1]|uniref:Uncharacterized protein n=1 Tax=Nosema bombycis (strain CQ1 / CVCC 102059) TaxID=578461 RepID=R0MKM4_NOSB1|nr:hypothetical protein NBO_81g0026 [Nosema bombycis CQ1]|eukprot:EOB13333.1 hypothetical protein NBO_81g0026 [Nosema bombycis CQ1]
MRLLFVYSKSLTKLMIIKILSCFIVIKFFPLNFKYFTTKLFLKEFTVKNLRQRCLSAEAFFSFLFKQNICEIIYANIPRTFHTLHLDEFLSIVLISKQAKVVFKCFYSISIYFAQFNTHRKIFVLLDLLYFMLFLAKKIKH